MFHSRYAVETVRQCACVSRVGSEFFSSLSQVSRWTSGRRVEHSHIGGQNLLGTRQGQVVSASALPEESCRVVQCLGKTFAMVGIC
jgi:hypothetical protein